MTVREIAEATGKDSRTVQRWVKTLSDKMSVLADKMSEASPAHPADFDLDETLAIIEKGMGKNAASMFAQNARNEMQNATQPNDIMTLMLKMIENQDKLIGAILGNQVQPPESKHNQLLLTGEPVTHMSLTGYSRANDLGLTESEKRTAGMVLRGICNERRLTIKPIPDAHYGRINTYPISILDEYFTP